MVDADGSTIPAYDAANPPPEPISGDVTTIQDPLFLENRDRKYSKVIYELRGVYNINDLDFDLRQFGLFLQNDTLFIEFHLNDMIAICGRRLMAGDVLELPHRRDDTIDMDDPCVPKFYVIEDASRAAGGYAATWWPHIWRVKCSPMTAGPEYQDILDQPATNPLGLEQGMTIGDLTSTKNTEMNINEAVVDEAKANFIGRYLETRQFYMIVPEVPSMDDPWIFAGDGIPPNGAVALGSGYHFPTTAVDGDYYLRTDYHPATLFRFSSGAWRYQEQDCRLEWSAAHRLLWDFIQEKGTETFPDGRTAPIMTPLAQAVKPRADF